MALPRKQKKNVKINVCACVVELENAVGSDVEAFVTENYKNASSPPEYLLDGVSFLRCTS